MNKSAMIRARVEDKLKSDVEKIFNQLGLNATEAITLFYKQIKLHKGLPFDIRIPNKTTKKVFDETDANINTFKAKDEKDLFNQLDI